jgi:serine/threonine protein kinase
MKTLPAGAPALGDRYAIERELGRGGMATVYLAQDLRHDLWRYTTHLLCVTPAGLNRSSARASSPAHPVAI